MKRKRKSLAVLTARFAFFLSPADLEKLLALARSQNISAGAALRSLINAAELPQNK